MSRIGLLFLCCVFSVGLIAQPNSLVKFRQEKVAEDSLQYAYEGLMNPQGDIIIPADYDYIWDFSEDTFCLARKLFWNEHSQKMDVSYQIITQSGFLAYEFPTYLVPENKSEGLFRCYNSRFGTFGFLDMFGSVVIRFRYTDAGDFHEGLAMAEDPNTFSKGYIDKQGNFVIRPSFKEAYPFSEGVAVAKDLTGFNFINKNGDRRMISSGSFEHVCNVSEGHAVVTIKKNDSLLYGLIDINGQIKLKPSFEFLDNFNEGTAVFVKRNKAGMINTKGEIIVPASYEELYRFDQLHYLFVENGKKGLFTAKGRKVLPAKYDEIDYFKEGLCPVNYKGKWGFADSSGREVIACQFPQIVGGFAGGKVKVKLPDRWWLINKTDTLLLKDHEEVLPFFGQTAPVKQQNLYGFINSRGELVTKPRFDELVFNANGLIFGRVTQKDSTFLWSVMNSRGFEITTDAYTEITKSSEGICAVKNANGWGFIDGGGIPISLPQYQQVRNFSEGRAAVKKNGEWGFVSNGGMEIIPVFSGIITVEDTLLASKTDTIQYIRERFPLFGMNILGDFKDNFSLVEDQLDKSRKKYCINRIGKILLSTECRTFEKVPENIPHRINESRYPEVLRTPGDWIIIDKKGKIIKN